MALFNEAKYERAKVLQHKARSLGIDPLEYADRLDELELEIGRKQELLSQRQYETQVQSWAERRLMIAGSYLAGASLKQLSRLLGVSISAVQNALEKELPHGLRLQIGNDRKGRKALVTQERASFFLTWFQEHRVDLCHDEPTVLAVKLRQACELAMTDDDGAAYDVPGVEDVL